VAPKFDSGYQIEPKEIWLNIHSELY